MMRIFIVGCGSIGERHIRNYMKLGQSEITAVDTNPERLEYIRKTHAVSTVHLSDLDKTLRGVTGEKAAIIATPNHLHVPLALACVRRDAHVFIEKPLAHDNRGVAALEKELKERGLVSLVACNMRFHPAIRYAKECLEKNALGRPLLAMAEFGLYFPYWRPSADYRKNYGAKKSEGGGVLLDLYHEFDYLYWFFGMPERLFCAADRQSDLEIDTEDNADVMMRFAGSPGIMCNLHVDYLQYKPTRTLKIIGDDGMYVWSNADKSAVRYSKKGEPVHTVPLAAYDFNDMYLDEMRHFLDCISRREQTISGVPDAKNVQSIIMQSKSIAAKNRMVPVR